MRRPMVPSIGTFAARLSPTDGDVGQVVASDRVRYAGRRAGGLRGLLTVYGRGLSGWAVCPNRRGVRRPMARHLVAVPAQPLATVATTRAAAPGRPSVATSEQPPGAEQQERDGERRRQPPVADLGERREEDADQRRRHAPAAPSRRPSPRAAPGVSRGPQQVGPVRVGSPRGPCRSRRPGAPTTTAQRRQRDRLGGGRRPLGAEAAGGHGEHDRRPSTGLGDHLGLGPEQRVRASTGRDASQTAPDAVEAEGVDAEQQPGAGGDQAGQQHQRRPVEAGQRGDRAGQDAQDEQPAAQRRRAPDAGPVDGQQLAARDGAGRAVDVPAGVDPRRPRRRAGAGPGAGRRPSRSATRRRAGRAGPVVSSPALVARRALAPTARDDDAGRRGRVEDGADVCRSPGPCRHGRGQRAGSRPGRDATGRRAAGRPIDEPGERLAGDGDERRRTPGR